MAHYSPCVISTQSEFNAVRIWSIANQKGGVGKTTTVVTLAGLLAERGARVLLVDLDPHGSLTSYFGHDPDQLAARSTFALFGEQPLDVDALRALLLPAGSERARLFAASPALATIERRSIADGAGLRLSKALALLWDEFDYVLVDTPPVLGALMINALAAAELLLVPVQTEFLALKGLERMVRTLAMVTRSLQKTLPYLIVPTMFDRRTQASLNALRTLRHEYTEHIWPSMIPIDTKLRDASRAGQYPSQFDASSRGVAGYRSLLKLLLSDGEQRLRA